MCDHTQPSRPDKPRKTRYLLLLAILLTVILPSTASALPAGFQEYYILGNETQVYRMFLKIQSDEGVSLITNPYMASVITVVATTDHQTIYYDHWEDGYEPDILNPIQPSTETYTDLRAGEIITLTGDGGSGTHRYVPVDPRGIALRYDGGDRLISAGGPIDIVHSLWPMDTTFIGGAWEVYPTIAWATGYSYVVPVGVDLYDGPTGYFADFKYVWLEIQALDDNTTVQVDNGTTAITIHLEQGETYSSLGYRDTLTDTLPITVNGGTTILANKPVQVGLVTGGDNAFQTRFYTLVPDTAWGNEYIAPIPRTTPYNETGVYMFNPNDTPHTVTAYDLDHLTGITFTIGAAAPLAYRQPSAVGRYIPSFSALRLHSDGPLWAIGSADTANTAYDWGFSFIPTRYATQDYYISWAPGTADRTANGSPVWVAPFSDDTTFCIDYSSPTADGLPDETFALDSLHTRRIFDPDNDQTGMHIWADKPFVLIWGADPDTAGAGENYLDLGYSVLPPHPDWLYPVLTLKKTADVQSLPPGDDTVTFLLQTWASEYPVTSLNLTDTLPLDWTYITNTAIITYPNGFTEQREPSITLTTTGTLLAWPLNATLDTNRPVEIRFQARITTPYTLGDTIRDDWESGDYSGGYGWNGPWLEYDSGACSGGCVTNTTAITYGPPHGGTHHLLIRADGAISRTADLTPFRRPALRFWRRLNELSSSDTFTLQLYDGLTWHPVQLLTAADDLDTYTADQIDLSAYRVADFALRWSGGSGNTTQAGLYLDDIEIFDAAAVQENRAEAVGSYEGHLFSSQDAAIIAISPLQLHQTVDKAVGTVGDRLHYTLTYTNASPVLTLTHVLIRATLPANTISPTLSAGGEYRPAAHSATWGKTTPLTLPPGASGSVTFSLSIDSRAADGQILHSEGTIDGDQTVEVAANPVETVVAGPQIAVHTVAPPSANAGQTITYAIEYANTGAVTATTVFISDCIPISTTYRPDSLKIDTGSGPAPLTDKEDGDAGLFTGSGILVQPGRTPGQIGPGESGTVYFSVIIGPASAGTDIANYSTLTRDYARPQDSALILTVISDLTLNKTASREIVGPGHTIRYTLTLEAGGVLTQSQVTVRDSIPEHTHYISGSAAAPPGFTTSFSTDHGATWSTTPPPPAQVTTIRWYTAVISGAATFSLTYRVQVDDPLGGGNVTISNRGQVTSTQTPLLYSDEIHIATVDLTLDKVTSGPTLSQGESLTYTITAGNNGSADANDVLITDRVPSQVRVLDGSISNGGVLNGDIISWTVSLPAQGNGALLNFAVTPDGASCGAEITNTAYAVHPLDTEESPAVVATAIISPQAAFSAAMTTTCVGAPVAFTNTTAGGDTFLWHFGDGPTTTTPAPTHTFAAPGIYTVTLTAANGCGVDTATATVTIEAPIFALAQRVTPYPPEAGRPVTYTILITNDGSCPATVTIRDHLPEPITLTTATAPFIGPRDGFITWTIPLSAGATRFITLTGTVDSACPAGTFITNTVRLTGPITTLEHSLAAPIVALADLAVVLHDNPDPVLWHSPLTYTLAYTNRGPPEAYDIAITATLPLSVSFGRLLTTTAGYPTTHGQNLIWRMASLSAGQSGQIVFTVTVGLNTATEITGTAVISGRPTDPRPDDNRALATTSVVTTPVITIWGTVFHDRNGNGRRDPGENGLPGVTISPGPSLTLTTDGTGRYLFTTTIAGPRTITKSRPAAYPPGGYSPRDLYGYFPTTAEQAHVDTRRGYTYRVDFGEATSDAGFLAIYGTVFADRDGDGRQDTDELGLAGVAIASDGGLTTTTDPYGRYTISATTAGVHGVAETDPDGHFSTTPNTFHLETIVGQGYRADFGDAPVTAGFATVYGIVYEDRNDDRQYDRGESGLPDVPITLENGTAAFPITTDRYGRYTISTTVVGLYTLRETDLEGYLSTTPNEVVLTLTLGGGREVNFGDVQMAHPCEVDIYEEDDEAAQARRIPFGTIQSHQFCDDGADWARFTARPGGVYTITTFSWGERADTLLSLFGDDGQTLLASNDDYEGATDYSSCLVRVETTGGERYIRVTNSGGLTGYLTGYGLQVEQALSSALYLPLVLHDAASSESVVAPQGVIEHTCPDEYEVDDTLEQAREIAAGEVQVHSFDSDPRRYAADKDFIFFDVVTPCVVSFEVLAPAGTGSLAGGWVELTLYDRDGNGLGIAGGGSVRHLMQADGRYYLRASPVAGAGYGCTDEAGYRLRMTIIPPHRLFLPIVLR